MWTFKPKGLTICWRRHERHLSLDGGPSYYPVGYFKTKGRTGAAARLAFSQLPSDGAKERVLREWASGRAAELRIRSL